MEDNKTNINWYPGHMFKTKNQIKEDLNIIDVVVEVLDARIPISSRNPDINEIIKNKKRLIVLNKADLANYNESLKWVDYFKSQGVIAILVNSNSGSGINEVIKNIEFLMSDELKKQSLRGRIGKAIRVMILGIPNVGKSSLINKLTNKKSAKVGNKPGVTKEKQWVRLNKKIEILDTPGVLWPKFKNKEVGFYLSYVGAIKDEILDVTEIAYNLLGFLRENYMCELCNRYHFTMDEFQEISMKDKESKSEILLLLELIANKRGVKKSGGELDLDRTSNIVIDEFRKGMIGKITLEKYS